MGLAGRRLLCDRRSFGRDPAAITRSFLSLRVATCPGVEAISASRSPGDDKDGMGAAGRAVGGEHLHGLDVGLARAHVGRMRVPVAEVTEPLVVLAGGIDNPWARVPGQHVVRPPPDSPGTTTASTTQGRSRSV